MSSGRPLTRSRTEDIGRNGMLLSETAGYGDAAAWATAIATVVLAFVAIYGDKIRYWLRLTPRPKLNLDILPYPPDCMRTTFRQTFTIYDPASGRAGFEKTEEIPCYYFRLRVINTGNCEAREVEVFAKDLKWHNRGEFERVDRFTPMNLLWSDVRQPFLPILSPQIPRHCDLAHVVKPRNKKSLRHALPNVANDQCVLALDLQVEPNSGGHLLGPGFYRLSLVLAAANSPPQESFLDIRVTGDWYDDDRMFSDGIRVRLK